MWKPGHKGHKNNKIANRLAKLAALEHNIGAEPACGISKLTVIGNDIQQLR